MPKAIVFRDAKSRQWFTLILHYFMFMGSIFRLGHARAYWGFIAFTVDDAFNPPLSSFIFSCLCLPKRKSGRALGISSNKPRLQAFWDSSKIKSEDYSISLVSWAFSLTKWERLIGSASLFMSLERLLLSWDFYSFKVSLANLKVERASVIVFWQNYVMYTILSNKAQMRSWFCLRMSEVLIILPWWSYKQLLRMNWRDFYSWFWCLICFILVGSSSRLRNPPISERIFIFPCRNEAYLSRLWVNLSIWVKKFCLNLPISYLSSPWCFDIFFCSIPGFEFPIFLW